MSGFADRYGNRCGEGTGIALFCDVPMITEPEKTEWLMTDKSCEIVELEKITSLLEKLLEEIKSIDHSLRNMECGK